MCGVNDGGRKESKEGGYGVAKWEMMKEVDECGYKYLGVLQTEEVMDKEMKKRVRDEYLGRVRLLAKSKLNAGNMGQGINALIIRINFCIIL